MSWKKFWTAIRELADGQLSRQGGWLTCLNCGRRTYQMSHYRLERDDDGCTVLRCGDCLCDSRYADGPGLMLAVGPNLVEQRRETQLGTVPVEDLVPRVESPVETPAPRPTGFSRVVARGVRPSPNGANQVLYVVGGPEGGVTDNPFFAGWSPEPDARSADLLAKARTWNYHTLERATWRLSVIRIVEEDAPADARDRMRESLRARAMSKLTEDELDAIWSEPNGVRDAGSPAPREGV